MIREILQKIVYEMTLPDDLDIIHPIDIPKMMDYSIMRVESEMFCFDVVLYKDDKPVILLSSHFRNNPVRLVLDTYRIYDESEVLYLTLLLSKDNEEIK